MSLHTYAWDHAAHVSVSVDRPHPQGNLYAGRRSFCHAGRSASRRRARLSRTTAISWCLSCQPRTDHVDR